MAQLPNKPPLWAKLDDFVWKEWFNNLREYVVGLTGGVPAVTSVGASAPLASSGGTTPTISVGSTIGMGLGGTGSALIAAGIVTSNGTVLSSVANPLPIANGGHGQTTANAGLNALLPVQTGQGGEVLMTDGTNTSWEAVDAAPYIFNGDFAIWQMGTGGVPTAVSGHTHADLWTYYAGANYTQYTISRQTGTTGFQYALRYARNSGQTDTGAQFLLHDMETIDSYQFQGKVVTVSFWARCGADYSASSAALGVRIETGTGTDQARRSGAYTGSSATTGTATLTTSWQRFTLSKTISTSATQLGIWFTWTPVGTAGANDWFEVTGVQIDEGAYAKPWRMVPMALRLEACQRRLFKTFPMATAPATASAVTVGVYRYLHMTAGATTIRGPFYPFPTRMRTAPTITTYNPINANANPYDDVAAADCTFGAAAASEVGVRMTCTGNAGSVVGNSSLLHFVADARI